MYKLQNASTCAVDGADKRSPEESDGRKAKHSKHSPDSAASIDSDKGDPAAEKSDNLKAADRTTGNALSQRSERSVESDQPDRSYLPGQRSGGEPEDLSWRQVASPDAYAGTIFDTTPNPLLLAGRKVEDLCDDEELSHRLENFDPDPRRHVDDDDDFERTAREIEPLSAQAANRSLHKLPKRLANAAQKGFNRQLSTAMRAAERDAEDEDQTETQFDHTVIQIAVENKQAAGDDHATASYVFNGRLAERRFAFGAEIAFVLVLAAAGTARLRTDIEQPAWQRRLSGEKYPHASGQA
ncbi:MAG TPA: hypothetical protein V6C72_02735, partial [Chroococcales cyanobacterium]